MPGGFHPFHAGHFALYQSAKKAFPGADLYVAATNDQSERPFPFALKEKLAKLAGVEPGHFVQVKSPFQAKEITQHYDPNKDVLVFVRSEKDRNEQPKPGGTKKDGSPAYFQPWTGKNLQPFSQHAYMAYLPTVEFGPGITSATQIRKAWPTLNDKRKTALVMSLYPAAQKNPKLAQNVVGMFDQVMGGQVSEGFTDIIKGIKRKVAGKEDPKEVEHMYGRIARSAIKHKTPDQAEKDIERYKKVSKVVNKEDVAEGSPIVVMPRADRLKKPEPTKVRYQGDIVPPTQPPSTEKRGVKGRPGQRPTPDQGVAEGWKDKVGAAALAGTMALGGQADAGQLGNAVAQGLGQGITSAAVSSVADKKRNARDTEFAKQIPDEADRAIYLKALKRVKYSRALRFSDPSMMGANAVTEIKFKKLKQEMAEKYNIATPVKEEDVAEAKSKAIAQTAKDLENPPKVMQHRAKRDMEREEQLKYRDIAGRDEDDMFIPGDTESEQILRYVKQHYPGATTKQQAFIKFVQRALKHSEEEDTAQDQAIAQLKQDVDQIKQKVNQTKVSESTDYLDEK